MLGSTFNPIRNGTRSKLHWIFGEIQSVSTLSLFLGCDPPEFLIEGLQRIFSSNLWEIVGISALFFVDFQLTLILCIFWMPIMLWRSLIVCLAAKTLGCFLVSQKLSARGQTCVLCPWLHSEEANILRKKS